MAKLNDLPTYASGLGDGDYSVGPDYAPAPEEAERDGIPHGKIIQFTMDSTESKFWPGTNGGFKRDVAVYVPAQYVPGTAAPVIVSCDRYGLSPRTGLIKNTLDNMIADHRLPVMVAVMVNPGPQRSIEYDTVSSKYADFVEAEVLPRAEKEAGITITKDPDARMTYGGSSGGVAAFTMAWFHPELYHRVLSYSGTYVNLQRSAEVPHGAWKYNEHLISDTPAKPLRVWMEVAEHDNGAATAGSAYRNWALANQNMAAVMKAKGYHYQLVYAKNAGHTDGKGIAQTFRRPGNSGGRVIRLSRRSKNIGTERHPARRDDDASSPSPPCHGGAATAAMAGEWSVKLIFDFSASKSFFYRAKADSKAAW